MMRHYNVKTRIKCLLKIKETKKIDGGICLTSSFEISKSFVFHPQGKRERKIENNPNILI